ncbi:proteasome activator complex subunit 4A-like [Dermacentor albipictus]|uniref:proteasome activator complex subunit 4A-like n=1 Tax=Dermacentor albipictus TaxID=60249 RepID=UPI0038FBE481
MFVRKGACSSCFSGTTRRQLTMEDGPIEGPGAGLQKRLVYNRLLPYSDQIDDEAAKLLAEIKTNLARSVMLREVKPATVSWTGHLNNYLKLYGYHFSKKDHVELVHLLLALIVIPDLELGIIQKLAHTLGLLLKKRELLSREDLSIEWRPLYELYERLLYSPYEHLGMLLLPVNLETNIKQLVRFCRTYFTVESTQEMLDEWEPLMCPFDVTMHKAMAYFELFLPTMLPPEQHDRGFKLWFDKFIGLWENSHNSPVWENNLVWLFARLAQNNIGYINWDPYIPTMFTRLLRSFNLPAASGKVQVNRHSNSYDSTPVVNWIASLLGGNSSCQTYVSHLFKAIESFYHPSNNGRWVTKLQRVLYKLPAEVVRRLHKERYRPPTWEPIPPESHRLTDAEVTSFVESVQPVVLLSMFSKGGSSGAAVALQDLALLRPELVIPPVIERLYSSLETLTEPHRLTAAMHCVLAVARSLVQGGRFFPEGPSHVVPLLNSCLPGIDPNDIRKCIVTFQFISTFATLVPLVDCSKAVSIRTDLTEIEQDVCLATAGFEDFVLQLMERCFSLIENSSLENPTRLDRDTDKMNTEENILEVGLSSTFSSILTQCSPNIFQAALQKLHSFVSNRILETRVSGRYVANLCRCMARVNPNLALATFVPHFTKLVLALTGSEEVATEELLDDELLFDLLLLSEMVRCNGKELLPHLPSLRDVLHRTLHLSSRRGYLLASSLLRNILRACSLVFPLDYRMTAIPWEQCLDFANYLPIREWGRAGDLDHLDIKWHVPTSEELACVQDLLETFLQPELQALLAWSRGERTLSREEVQRSLNLVLDCILGAGLVLPLWPGEPINLLASKVPAHFEYKVYLGIQSVDFKSGENVRQVIATIMRKVLDHTLETHEDDIKSLCLIIKIYHELMFFWGIPKDDFDTRWKGFNIVKKGLENRLARHKQHIRALLVDRAQLQQEMRVLSRHLSYFTELHQDLMFDLSRLATSHYSEVRIQAQEVLGNCVHSYPGSHTLLLKGLLQLLTPERTEVTHEQFKGALYTLLGKKQRTMLVLCDWPFLGSLWPALVGARHSEKPSIIWLLEHILETLQKHLETIQLALKVPASCLECAQKLALAASAEEMSAAVEAEEQCNNSAKKEYENLVCKLVTQVESGSLHWRHYHMALVMVKLLIRNDVPLPGPAVHMLVNHLVHDTLNVRKVAILGVGTVLKQLKKKHVKQELAEIDQESIELSPTLTTLVERVGGKRPANLWLQYNSALRPDTREQWQKHHFVHKTHIGFYRLPQPFLVYAPEDQQPSLDCTIEEMMPSEADIFKAFTSETFVEQLSKYLSLEERKGHDRFDAKRFYMFKGLFRNYGSALLPLFEKVLLTKIASNQESHQRCALEILAGLMRGSKHWGFDKMQELRAVVEPVLRLGMTAIMPETLPDWGTCMATISESRDPNKYHWFFELLLAEPAKSEEGSFLQSSRLYVQLGGLAQQEWRVCELLEDLLERLKPRLTHSYQNVRDKIGGLLCNIFLYDVQLPMFQASLTLVPRRLRFMDYVMSVLAPLTDAASDEPPSNSSTTNNHRNDLACHDGQVTSERKAASRLLQTVCKWILASVSQSPSAAPPEIFRVVPVLCQMQSDQTDEELQKDCAVALALLGNALLPPESIRAALATIGEVIKSPHWHSRAASCNLLQFLVFTNLFTMQSCSEWRDTVIGHTLALLKDERLEVRETASETLGGLLHCEFLKVTDGLLAVFKAQCMHKKRTKRARSGARTPLEPCDLIERHAGILGLCACVNAFPYDVPPFMPEVLVLLGDHLNEPPPIPATIKKTLSNFRRTHHDNWRDHKVKFTDDQLAVITDLLVSPSYYA